MRKPARPSLTERLNLKYWAFRALAALVPLTPLWLARRMAYVFGTLAWALAGSLRRRAERNLGRVPSLAGNPAKVRRAARELFVHMALNYLDFFRGRFVTYDELARGWDIHGWELFEQSMSAGRGAIVFGAHIGPFEYSAWKLGELGQSLLTPAERLRPERFNQLVASLRNHHRTRMLPGDERDTLRELLTALRSGQLVMFAVDRWVMGPSDTWPLFGAPARLPTAPFALAARSDAPVVLMIPWRVGFNRIEAVVEVVTPERMPSEDGSAPASGGEARGDREAAIARMRQRVYPILERYINEHPEQWVSALSTVWDDAKGNVDRSTIVERSVEHAAEAAR